MTQLELYLQTLAGYVGYQEEADGTTVFGRTYGERHGDDSFTRADWCVMYLSETARKLGISDTIIPDTASVPQVYRWGSAYQIGDVAAQVGDLVIYEWGDAAGEADGPDHIGIVERTEGDTPDDQILYMLEGNWGDSVARTSYTYRDRRVWAILRPPYAEGEVEGPRVEAPFLLRKGDVGEGVQLLQMALSMLGYSIDIDGDFGPATDAALRAFQQEHQLMVDGIAGTQTWETIVK